MTRRPMTHHPRLVAASYGYLLFLGILCMIGAIFDEKAGISLLLGALYITVATRQLLKVREALGGVPQQQTR